MLEIAVICLALNVYHEAKFEPVESQIAVTLVVLNRAKRRPERVCAEVFKHRQFSWTMNPPPIHSRARFERFKKLVRQVWQLSDFTGGATHYHADYVRPYWSKSKQRVGQWGRHVFYK